MQYSVLLVGKNNAIKEDFFTYMKDDFECLSTSNRYDDIVNHLNHFTPNALVYCLENETPDNIRQILSVKDKLNSAKIPLVAIGSRDDCDYFMQYASNTAKLILAKPLANKVIAERLCQLFGGGPVNSNYAEKGKKKSEKEKLAGNSRPKTRSDDDILGEVEALLQAVESKKTKKKHVLVVDDDPLMLKLVKEQLHEEYDVGTAINGRVALKFLENRKTDLILLDYDMPEMNGVEVMEKLKERDATKSIPVVFLTGVTEKEKIQKVVMMKPRGYLLKPINREQMMATIKKQIG